MMASIFRKRLALAGAFALCQFNLLATCYYVDSRTGDDAFVGTLPAEAWRSLQKINAQRVQAGDVVYFRAGSAWSGQQLVIAAQGTAKHPVVFRSYGKGPRPRIDTAGAFADAILVRNAQNVELRDFEITNLGNATNGSPRRGVHILAENAGTLTNIFITGLFIHDVNGTQSQKDNGGIIFRTLGERVPTRFDGLRIERNIIWRVDRSGIAAQSYHAQRTRWFPSRNVVIRDNWLGDVGGDGIVPWATDGALVEHNILQGANERARTYNAGIWPWSTDNTVMRLNRASGVKTLMDGQGFDSDYNSRNTVVEFNLSHDNQGGFILICTPGQRRTNENCGNIGTTVRYNISRHDRTRAFHLAGAAEQTLIHDNAIYTAPGSDVQMLLLSDWSGWADGLDFRNNLFHSEGVARYGHQVSREKDGSYGLGSGWGPARSVRFQNNRYVGRHESPPEETVASVDHARDSAPKPVNLDWPGPQFDPAHPEDFDRFISAHRKWMLKIMKKQFGRTHAPAVGSQSSS